jgi:hypothetical protein
VGLRAVKAAEDLENYTPPAAPPAL